MDTRIGTCGWSFKDWRGSFYPPGTKDELAYYATQFDAIEIDSTWYRVPEASVVDSWRRRVPEGFTFCPKMPGEITHDHLLVGADDVRDAFLSNISLLGDKLGPIVIQLSPKFKASEIYTLEGFLRELPSDFRYVVEFRNKSWMYTEDALGVLGALGMGVVIAHHPWYPRIERITTDIAYIRLLGKRDVFPDFSTTHRAKDKALDKWAELLLGLVLMPGDAYAFINNQFEGHSPESARKLKRALGAQATTLF